MSWWSPRPASHLLSCPTVRSRGGSVSPTRAFSSPTFALGATRSVSRVSSPLPLRFPVFLLVHLNSQTVRTAAMERSSPPPPALPHAPTAVSAASTPSASPSLTIAPLSTRSARTARPPPPSPPARGRAATTEPSSSRRSVPARPPPTSAASPAFAASPRQVRPSRMCAPSTT